jgi:hypothetical protein
MRVLLFAAALLLVGMAAMPSASAADIQPPPQCLVAPCCFAPCPPPCYDCPPPGLCAPLATEIDEGDAFGLIGRFVQLGMVYVGPHAGLRLNADCSIDVWATDIDCQSHLLPLAHDEEHEVVGPVEVSADTCQLGFICACMPADIASTSSAQPPNPCGPTALCQGPECPEVDVATSDFLAYMGPHAGLVVSRSCKANVWADPLPVEPASSAMAPPCQTIGGSCCTFGFAPCPGPRCVSKEVATSDFLAYLGPHAGVALHSDCSVSVSEAGTVCPSIAPQKRTVHYDAGPGDVTAQGCVPVIYCTCDPMLEVE